MISLARSGALWMALAMAGLAVPVAAHAQCPGTWDLRGEWLLDQDNGYQVKLRIKHQERIQVCPAGTACEHVISGDAASWDQHGELSLFKRFSGTFNGFRFSMNLSGPGGFYAGRVDDRGRISGTTWDLANGDHADWHSSGVAGCLVATAPSPPQVPSGGLDLDDQYQDTATDPAGAVDYVLLSEGTDLTVAGMSGPGALQAGLSGTYKVTVRNAGNVGAPVELHIIFGGKLDQTGRIVAGAGLYCEVGHDAGINAALKCTGGQLEAGATASVVVQGRGQSAGAGMLIATLNPSRAVAEASYDNNFQQLNVAIQ